MSIDLPLNVYRKLLEVKKKVPYIQKDKDGFNYKYATPSAVFGVINPVLNDLGLLLITNVIDSKSYEITQKVDKQGKLKPSEWKFDLNFIFDWVDVETGEKISIPWSASGCNGDDKGLGSALTYAERYFVLKQFNIPTDSDDPDSFQDKHMTAEEKKQFEKLKIQEIRDAIESIGKAADVPALLALKKKFATYIVSDASFIAAGNARYNVLMSEAPKA